MSSSIPSLESFVAHLDANLSVVTRGWAALSTLHSLLVRAQRDLGVEITYDPASEPTLLQYIAVSTIHSCEDACKGAAIGLLIGLLFSSPRHGLLIGAALGGAVGVARGVDAVARGWRVHIAWDTTGQPTAVVTAH